MNLPFPWIVLLVGCGLALMQFVFPQLPLLTRLIMNEFGFFLCLIGAGMAIRDLRAGTARRTLWVAMLGCALLALAFLYMGFQLWPEGGLTGGQ